MNTKQQMKDLKKVIRELKKQRIGYTQVAAMFSVSKQTVCNWLHGRNRPMLDIPSMVVHLTKVLNDATGKDVAYRRQLKKCIPMYVKTVAYVRERKPIPRLSVEDSAEVFALIKTKISVSRVFKKLKLSNGSWFQWRTNGIPLTNKGMELLLTASKYDFDKIETLIKKAIHHAKTNRNNIVPPGT